MKNKDLYKLYRKATRDYKSRTRIKSTFGNKLKASEVMCLMILDGIVEKALGYEMNDSGSKIIKRRRPNAQSEECSLAIQASNGDLNAARTLLERMSNPK
jgi:hypothetical protein